MEMETPHLPLVRMRSAFVLQNFFRMVREKSQFQKYQKEKFVTKLAGISGAYVLEEAIMWMVVSIVGECIDNFQLATYLESRNRLELARTCVSLEQEVVEEMLIDLIREMIIHVAEAHMKSRRQQQRENPLIVTIYNLIEEVISDIFPVISREVS